MEILVLDLKTTTFLLVLYGEFLVFYMMIITGILVPGEGAPADPAGYWMFVNILAVLVCVAGIAYLLSVFIRLLCLRVKKIMGRQLPPPAGMDMC